MNKPVIVLGAGGHASVLIDILRRQGRTILAIVAPKLDESRVVLAGVEYWKNEERILNYSSEQIELVNGIGSLPGNLLRAQLFTRYRKQGYNFACVISPHAIVSDYAVLEEGVQIMAGSVVQTGTFIGQNSIINTGAIVDHDCKIGSDNHIAPGAVLCGGVKTGQGVHIGTGATVIQGISVGEYSVVAAGATLTQNLSEKQIIYVARGCIMPGKQ